MARIAAALVALVAVLAIPSRSSVVATPEHHNLTWPHALRGEKSCGTMHVSANDTQFLVFTRHVRCRKASHLVRESTMGVDWPKHWWPRQENHKIWINHGFASWRHSALRHNRHVRALYLPLGSHTLSVGAGDVLGAQYKPVRTELTGDGSDTIMHTHWSSWTRRQAHGRGIDRERTYRRSPPYNDWVPARVRAYRPRTKCGQHVFTRYAVRLAHHPKHGGRRRFVINRSFVAC